MTSSSREDILRKMERRIELLDSYKCENESLAYAYDTLTKCIEEFKSGAEEKDIVQDYLNVERLMAAYVKEASVTYRQRNNLAIQAGVIRNRMSSNFIVQALATQPILASKFADFSKLYGESKTICFSMSTADEDLVSMLSKYE